MTSIAIMDTSISDFNLGNQIIMESIYKHLDDMFLDSFLFHIPYMEITNHTIRIINEGGLCFFGGTNVLSAKLEKYAQWGINIWNYKQIKNFVLFGVGWWQYQSKISRFTSKIFKTLLNNDYIHAVRDGYTESMLRSMGINNVLNTGCPSIWDMDDYQKPIIGDSVVFTITDYNKNPIRDRKMIAILKKSYNKLYCWLQGIGDLDYLKEYDFIKDIIIIPPRLSEYDKVLTSMNIDYVGTRLHAGIRAMQKKKRAFVIGIDNRAIEMHKDFNIPVIYEDKIDELEILINQPYLTRFNIPGQNIFAWKKQFMISSQIERRND